MPVNDSAYYDASDRQLYNVTVYVKADGRSEKHVFERARVHEGCGVFSIIGTRKIVGFSLHNIFWYEYEKVEA